MELVTRPKSISNSKSTTELLINYTLKTLILILFFLYKSLHYFCIIKI